MSEQVINPGNLIPSQDVVSSPLKSGWHQAVNAAKNAMYGAAVAYEMLPIDEASRAAVFAGTQTALNNPLATGAAVAAATFAIEGAGAVSTANLLASDTGNRFTEKLNKVLGKIGLSGLRTNGLIESAVAVTAGVPLTLALKQQQDPGRTASQNRRYGVKAAAGVSSVVGAMTYLAAEGVSAVESMPEKVGVGALALGTVALVGQKVRSHLSHKREAKKAQFITSEALADYANEGVKPDYELSDMELRLLESGIVDKAMSQNGRGVSAVWISPHSPYANYIRTHENRTFDGLHIPELFEKYEAESAFLALVDTRKGDGRIIRGTRISSPQFNKEGIDKPGEIRIAMIQDLLDSGQITYDEFTTYYKAQGIDPNKCISVETNFKIGERAPRRFGMIPMSQLAYLAMYKYVLSHKLNSKDAAIFAHINDASEQSLSRLGVDIASVAGDPELRTPDTEGKYDDNYRPVALLNTEQTRKAMRRISMLSPSELKI